MTPNPHTMKDNQPLPSEPSEAMEEVEQKLIDIFAYIADELIKNKAEVRSEFHADLSGAAIIQIKELFTAYASQVSKRREIEVRIEELEMWLKRASTICTYAPSERSQIIEELEIRIKELKSQLNNLSQSESGREK